MSIILATAAALAFFTGLVHSVLGEFTVFARMRQGHLVPTNGGTVLKPFHVRILWASWHVATVFGWFAAATLLVLASKPVPAEVRLFLLVAVSAAMLSGSLLVLYGTKGRHPGWVAMLLVAILSILGIGA